MRLLRYGPVGLERPGLLDTGGRIRDLSAHVHDVAGSTLLPECLQRLCAIDWARLPLVEEGARLGPCVGKVGKLVVLEERAHAQHSLHLVATSALSGAQDPVLIPAGLTISCAPRLGVVIGRAARDIPVARALEHVAGYCILAGVLPQDGRRQHLDTFAPLGPWLVTTDESGPFEVAAAVSVVSGCMSLQPGDILSLAVPGSGDAQPCGLGEAKSLTIAGLGAQLFRTAALQRQPVSVERAR